MPALRARAGSGFAHEAGAIAEALDLGVGGFIIFGGTVESVRRLTSDLLRRAERPLLLASDLGAGRGPADRGAHRVSATARPRRPRGRVSHPLGSLSDRARGSRRGDQLGVRARGRSRHRAREPHRPDPGLRSRAPAGRHHGQELDRGVSGRRRPGMREALSRARAHHGGLPRRPARCGCATGDPGRRGSGPVRHRGRGGRGLGDDGARGFPGLDPEGLPATLSSPILGDLRGRLGFDGLVVTDALIMDGALVGRRESDAALEAIRAGVDVLLYPNDPRRVRDALDQAVTGGTWLGQRLAQSLERYQRALAQATAPTPPVTRGPYESAEALADALLEQGMLRGTAPRLTAPFDLAVVDDDLGGPYSPVRAIGSPARSARSRPAATPKARAWCSPSPSRGPGRGAGVRPRGTRRPWRARPRRRPGCPLRPPPPRRRDPKRCPDPAGVDRQRLMQEAVARWLRARARLSADQLTRASPAGPTEEARTPATRRRKSEGRVRIAEGLGEIAGGPGPPRCG